MKKHIPNALTCLNLLCGCLALTYIFAPAAVATAGPPDYRGYFAPGGAMGPPSYAGLVTAGGLVALAAIADFFDGFAARVLRVASPIGKDLDSLADMVSFGVVPGAIMMQLVRYGLEAESRIPFMPNIFPAWVPYLAFSITVFSALRLAKFNNDTRQTDSFIGLPTPACTLVVAALPLIVVYDRFGATKLLQNPWFLVLLTAVLSGLLVAEIPLFALKFKTFRWVDNRRRYVFIGLTIALLLGLGVAAVPLAVLAYVALSLVPKNTKLPPSVG